MKTLWSYLFKLRLNFDANSVMYKHEKHGHSFREYTLNFETDLTTTFEIQKKLLVRVQTISYQNCYSPKQFRLIKELV